MNVAQTILSQIKAIDARALWAWGAKDLINMGDGLKFKSSGMTRWKGYVYIKYDEGNDLYNIDFFRFRKMEPIYDRRLQGVYADELVHVIDSQVG